MGFRAPAPSAWGILPRGPCPTVRRLYRASAVPRWTDTKGALLPWNPALAIALSNTIDQTPGTTQPPCKNGVPARPDPGRRMAQYHLSGHPPVSRSNGQKVIRSAAYAAGERLRDDRYGEEHDFSRRRHVLYNAMTVPENAPDWAHNRETFWNAVEAKEKRKDSQLAIPYDIALPHELSLPQNIALLNEYVKTEFTDRGLVADIAIHKPDPRRDQRNVHAHILIPTRPIDEDGLGPKPRNADSRKGWEQEREENIVRLRMSWADHANRHLEAAGFDVRIDHRSLEEQGIDREPTRHRGVASDHMQERGLATERGDEYRNIQAENEKRALRKQQRKDYARVPEAPKMPDAQSPEDKIADEAIRKEQDRQEQARKDQDKLQNELVAADNKLKELGQIYREAQQHREMLIKQAQELEQANHRWEQQQEQRQREEQRRQNPYEEYAKLKDVGVENRRQDLIEKRDRQYLEGDIRDAGTRYAQALHHNYDFLGDPYQSLAKVAIAEHASFRTDQNLLSAEIAKTADPKAREALEIRRKIEGYEYLVQTGERIAVQSELITGRGKDSPEAIKMRERVNGEVTKDEKGNKIVFPGYRQEADNLRFSYRELQAERQQAPGKEQAQQPATPQPRPTRQRRRDSMDERIKQQDDLAKAKEAERLAKMTDAERQKQQEKERERQRERERER
jgi:hypothetical protein